MKSKDIQIPFVSGQDTSGSPKATSETGKFRRVHNLRIAPANADALSVRTSATSIAVDNADPNKRVAHADGVTSLVKPTGISQLNDAETGWESTSSVRNLDLLSAAPIEFSGYSQYVEIYGSAFLRDSVGDELTAIYVQGLTSASSANVITQAKINGVKRDAIAVGSWATTPNNHGQAIYAFAGDTTDRMTVVHGDPELNFIRFRRYTKSTATWTVHLSISNAFILDAVQCTAGIAVLYRNTTTNLLRIALLTQALVTTFDVVVNAVQTSPQVGSVCQTGTSNILHIYSGGYNADSNTLRAFTFNTTTSAVVTGGTSTSFGAVVIALSSCAQANIATGSWLFVVGDGDARARLFQGLSDTASFSALAGWSPRIVPFGRIFTPTSRVADVNPRPYVLGALGTQIGIWSLDQATATPVQNVLMYSGSRAYYQNPAGQDPRSRGQTLYHNGDSGKGVVITNRGPELIEWGLSQTRAAVVSHAGFQVMSLGSPKAFDGSRWLPIGFSQYPVATLTPAATGALSAGVYTYGLVWEWTDSKAHRYQSPVSLYTVTVAAGQRVDIAVRSYSIPADERLKDPAGATRLVVYRSQAGGTQLNRHPNVTQMSMVTVYSTDTFTVSDTVSDATLAQGEIIYTTAAGGNELAAYGMDAADMVVGYSDRFIWHTPAFPSKLFYTKSFRDGRGIECNPALAFFAPGDVTGLATQDGNVYVFTANQVFAFSPQFANDDGSGAGAVDPTPLSHGIGTIYPASILNTPEGIFFRGQRGFFLLPRGGGPPVYAGLPAEGTVLPAVLGAAHNAATSELVFVTSFGTQQILVYNYLFKQWFTWELFAGNSILCDGGVFASQENNFFYFGESASSLCALLRLDAEGIGTDFGSGGFTSRSIGIVVETADFSIAEIAKQTRVTSVVLDVEGTGGGNVLSVAESVDQGASYVNANSYAANTGEPIVYQVLNRRTSGIRIRISSVAQTLGVKLYGMTIKVKPLAKAIARSTNRKG
jgi:hypothetical protein